MLNDPVTAGRIPIRITCTRGSIDFVPILKSIVCAVVPHFLGQMVGRLVVECRRQSEDERWESLPNLFNAVCADSATK